MKKDRQNWQLKEPLALEQINGLLPDPYRAVQETAEDNKLELLDDFDWSLWQAGLLLLRRNNDRLSLRRQQDDSELAAAAGGSESRFWWQLEAGELADRLREQVAVRAFVPKFSCRLQQRRLAILNADEKTVVRLRIDAIDPADDECYRFAELLPLRGYQRDYAAVGKALEALAPQPLPESGLAAQLLASGLKVEFPVSKPSFDLVPAEPAESAVTRMAVKMLQVARHQEQGIIDDIDTEFVHQYRVNIRKTRSLISLFRKSLDSARYRMLKTELKALGSLTNELRDLDVFLLDHDYYRDLLPENLWPGLEQLFRRIRRRRNTVFCRVKEALSSDAYLEQISTLLRDLQKPPELTGKQANQPIKSLACKKILQQYRAIQVDGGAIAAQTPDEAVHELRIECKKLRYLLELFAELFPKKELKQLVKELKGLQDNLGRFNDFSVQQEFLQHFAQGTRAPEQLASIHGLAAVLHNKQRYERSLVVDSIGGFIQGSIDQEFQQLFSKGKAGS